MKRILTLLLLFIGNESTFAQQFQMKSEIALPDSILQAQSKWVNLDNDGLLDLLVSAKSIGDRSYLYFVKGDTVNVPQLRTEILPILSYNAVEVTDYDLDNDLDVIVSGTRNGIGITVVYLNKGAFQFEEHTLNVPVFSICKFADLDNDASAEWIISGTDNGSSYTKILKRDQQFHWQVVHDSIKFQLSALEVVDADGDGRFDLFVSGRVKSDSLVSGFLINKNAFYFKEKNIIEFFGSSSTGDINADGLFDVLISGKDLNSVDQTKLFQSDGNGYVISDYPIGLTDVQAFMTDLNSDGVLDVNYSGKNNLGDTLNINRYGSQDYDTLNSKKFIAQYFGDAEHDGDLDLIQLVQREVIYLVLYENKVQKKNAAPKRPAHAVALSVFNRIFLYWDKSSDDHTSTFSLTYDVFLNGNSDYQVGSFDLLNDKRLSVSHGNNSTGNFRLLRGELNGNLTLFVQSVDNSFHADPSSVCTGGGVGGSDCATVEANALTVCNHEDVVLRAPHDVLWFSFAKGFVGVDDEFSFHADQPDTIFLYDPQLIASGCAALKSWTLKINNDTIKTELDLRYACVGSQLTFEVESGWDNVKWKSDIKGDLESSENIAYVATENDTVSVTLKNIESCTIQRKTAIQISKPELVLVADQYKIMKGSSVTLGASGADRYEWSPSTFLSQINVPNPIATPTTTIQYTVKGYDSIHCSSQGVVTVIVEDSGFVPTLFTPNDDGQNDALKIYGLTTANDFVFAIYNREGSLVFKTSDVNEAAQRGWDGFTNGTKQPGGIYFWKVKGNMSTGRKVLLNGKESGSIVLVR